MRTRHALLLVTGLLLAVAVFWVVSQPTVRRADKATAFLNHKNGRIDFWGLVVDQDGKPLEGVEILMDTRIWGLGVGFDAKFVEFQRTTDANGRFELLNAAGDSLGIKAVRKSGYVLSPEGMNGGKKSFPYHGMSQTFTPDARIPVVIRLWKAKGAAALIYYDRVGGPNLPVDGTAVHFDLIAGKKVAQGGHLEVRLFRDPKDAWGHKRNGFSWRTEISVPGGGLQWREDTFGYEAPADGYVPTLVMGQEANDPAWKSQIQGQFYFRTAEGYYGRIEFQQNTDAQPPPCPFYITCYLNPNGSRNLEYEYKLRIDPRKLVASTNPNAAPAATQAVGSPFPTNQPANPPPGVPPPGFPALPPQFTPPTNNPAFPQPPPGFQALTNRGRPFPPPAPPRPPQ